MVSYNNFGMQSSSFVSELSSCLAYSVEHHICSTGSEFIKSLEKQVFLLCCLNSVITEKNKPVTHT